MIHDTDRGAIERGTNGTGKNPVMTIEPRSTKVGVWDAGRIIPVDESDQHHGPFLPDDVIVRHDGRVWRVVWNHNGQRLTGWEVTDVYLNMLDGDRRLLADLADTYHDVSPEGQR